MQIQLNIYSVIALALSMAAFLAVLYHYQRKGQALAIELQTTKVQLKALKLSEALLKEAQTLTKVGSYEIDLKGQRSRWSEQAAINFGLPGDADMNEIDWAVLIDPRDKNLVDQCWKVTTENARMFDLEYRIVRPNGDLAYMHGIGRPIFDESGCQSKIVGTIRDVTESTFDKIKLKEQEVKSLQSERMAFFGKIAGAVAHEINNPLAIIHGSIQLLQRKHSTNQMSPELFLKSSKQMMQATQRISSIVKNIQACSTDSSNETRDLVDISDLVENVAQIFSSLARNQNVNFKFTSPQIRAEIECQPTEISQAILNLLMNARDAVAHALDPTILLETKILGDRVLIRVSNNGPTLNSEMREKIWEPFFSTKAEGKSLGLGLSISKAIVKRHGGSIELDKDRMETSFVILIPSGITSSHRKNTIAAN